MATAQPVATFEAVGICMDTIKYNAPGRFIFRFTNTGDQPLIILNGQTSGGGLMCSSWTKDPIPPGKTGQIEFLYDTHRVGNMNKTGVMTSNAGVNPLSVRGYILPRDSAYEYPTRISFGTVVSGTKLCFTLPHEGDKAPSVTRIRQISGRKAELKAEDYRGSVTRLEFCIGPEEEKGSFRKQWQVYIAGNKRPVVFTVTGNVK